MIFTRKLYLCIGSVLGIAAIFLCCYRHYDIAHKSKRTNKVVLRHTKNPAEIPFQEVDGGLEVTISVDGTQIKGIIDTGTTYILLPPHFDLSGTHSMRRYRYEGDNFDGTRETGKMVKLPDVRIGTYRLHNIPAVSLGFHSAESPSSIVLGSSAFQKAQVTFDFQKHTCLILPSSGQSKPQSRASGEHIINFAWTEPSQLAPGLPSVHATINGHPALLIVDTGAQGLALTGAYCRRCHLVSPLFLHKLSRQKWQMVPHMAFSLGGIQMTADDVFLERDANPQEDGVIGTELMRHFLTTIDYGKREVILKLYTP